jgi:hypothetical protein
MFSELHKEIEHGDITMAWMMSQMCNGSRDHALSMSVNLRSEVSGIGINSRLQNPTSKQVSNSKFQSSKQAAIIIFQNPDRTTI